MTPERIAKLMGDDNEQLTPEELAAHWHFCPDWDGLLIAPHMGEWNHCYCPKYAKIVCTYKPEPPSEGCVF